MTTFNDQLRQWEKIQDRRYEDKLLEEDKADYEMWLDEQEFKTYELDKLTGR